MSAERPRVAFVLEQHVGHRTYAENLRSAVEASGGVDPVWVPVTYAPLDGVLGHLGPVGPMLRGRSEVRAGLADRDTDVHVFNTQVPAAIGGRVARSQPYVLITDVTPRQYDEMAEGYGHSADRPGPVRWWKDRVNRRTFAGAAWCVGWSSWATRSMTDDYGVDPATTSVIAPGVDTSRWRPGADAPAERPRVLFVGGEFGRKGGDLLLEAFASVSDRCDVWIVTTSQVSAGPGVHVVDDLRPNDPRLLELYRSAAVFVLPSRAETFGIAAVEAASVGVPAIVSRVGGLGDIVVDGETGITIAPGDATELGRSLAALLDDEARRRAMGVAARARALEQFDAQVNADRLVEIARRVAAGSSG